MAWQNILITGGAGFIGSHLSRKLVEGGARVVIYDDLSVGKEENVPTGATLVVGSILDFERMSETLSGIDGVFHLAARVSIRASMDQFYEDSECNLLGTVNLLRALRKSTVKKLVFASSMAVYADCGTPDPIPESYKTAPISFYGISKLASEEYVRLAGEALGIQTAILRYFNTYGPAQAYSPYVGVITIFVNRLLSGEPPVIFGNGEQRRDFISVHDLVRANIAAMEWNGASGVFNVGTGKAHSVNEIADLLIRKLSPGMRPVYESERPGELRNSIADISRARSMLSFKPMIELSDALDDIIAWNRRKSAQ